MDEVFAAFEAQGAAVRDNFVTGYCSDVDFRIAVEDSLADDWDIVVEGNPADDWGTAVAGKLAANCHIAVEDYLAVGRYFGFEECLQEYLGSA